MPPRLKFLKILTLRHYINSYRGNRKNPPTIAEVNPLHLTNIKEVAGGTFLCKIYFHKSLSKVLKIVLTFTFCVDSDRNNGLAFRVFRCFLGFFAFRCLLLCLDWHLLRLTTDVHVDWLPCLYEIETRLGR